jgi:hypothetical protein
MKIVYEKANSIQENRMGRLKGLHSDGEASSCTVTHETVVCTGRNPMSELGIRVGLLNFNPIHGRNINHYHGIDWQSEKDL